MAARASFGARVLAWWRVHGRRELPWQRRPTPYRVWVSEIMLQQTRVAAVVPYFERFTRRFPGVRALAGAATDEVLAHWSGLGYYARARNLHRAARVIRDHHRGRFPRRIEEAMALPGIGRSTAGAILSLALGQRHPILDGNVKRVLARHAGVDGWPGTPAVQRELWQLAQQRLPRQHCAEYTQAIMDLGATLCTARRPACGRCPVRGDCRARLGARVQELPAPRPRRAVPRREAVFLIARAEDGALLLERRPPAGVWGGLWCPPWCDGEDEARARLAALGLEAQGRWRALPAIEHGFSHFRLRVTPLEIRVRPAARGVAAGDGIAWATPGDAAGLGLAAPVARLVASLASPETGHRP